MTDDKRTKISFTNTANDPAVNTRALLVGGPADGRRLVLSGHPTVVYLNELDGSLSMSSAPDEPVKTIQHKYVRIFGRMITAYEDDPVQIFCHPDVRDWLSALVDGYRGEGA